MVRPAAQGLVVEVVDGGPGIAPRERDRVFEGLWRGSDRQAPRRRPAVGGQPPGATACSG